MYFVLGTLTRINIMENTPTHRTQALTNQVEKIKQRLDKALADTQAQVAEAPDSWEAVTALAETLSNITEELDKAGA